MKFIECSPACSPNKPLQRRINHDPRTPRNIQNDPIEYTLIHARRALNRLEINNVNPLFDNTDRGFLREETDEG